MRKFLLLFLIVLGMAFADQVNGYGDKTYTFPSSGLYRIELYGAAGGTASPCGQTVAGGRGGYASGYREFNAGQVINLHLGGMGGGASICSEGGGPVGGGWSDGSSGWWDGNEYMGQYYVTSGGGGSSYINYAGGRLLTANGGGGVNRHTNGSGYGGGAGSGSSNMGSVTYYGTTYSASSSSGGGSTGNAYAIITKIVPQFKLDLNGVLNGSGEGHIGGYATANVDVGGIRRATGITDYYSDHDLGAYYSITVTPNSGVYIKNPSNGSWTSNPVTFTGTVQNGGTGVWPELRTYYTNTIWHWTWGYQNQEGNNGAKNAFHIGNTSFTGIYGENYTIGTDRKISVPNGFTLRDSWGSDLSGSWTGYQMGTVITQGTKGYGIEFDYDPVTYNIFYELDGGVNNSANPSTYNVLYGVTFQPPTKEGYRFNGWYVNNKKVTGINPGANASFSSSDDLYKKLSIRTTGDITVKASWTEIYKKVNIKCISNGENSIIGLNDKISGDYFISPTLFQWKYWDEEPDFCISNEKPESYYSEAGISYSAYLWNGSEWEYQSNRNHTGGAH